MANQTKYTQGKWHFNSSTYKVWSDIEVNGNNPIICDLATARNIKEPEIYTNGNLIATAPEMLEVLSKVHNAINRLYDSEPELAKELGFTDELFIEIESTIEKATK